MIEQARLEAIQFWNEPNNFSHWDVGADADKSLFVQMVTEAAQTVQQTAPGVLRVLGGLNPIDPVFLERLKDKGLLEHMDAVALHGYPLDWNLWRMDEWPTKIDSVRAITNKPVWVTESGASSFGADEMQARALQRMAELLIGRADRVYWHSLLDLPPTWPADTNRKENEGSAYYRHFYQGLIRAEGSPKPAAQKFALFAPVLGVSQNFQVNDPRLPFAIEWLRRLDVRQVRTTLRWPDWERPDGPAWADTLLTALAPFEVTLTLCFTPPGRGRVEDPASPPRDLSDFAHFVETIAHRYAGQRRSV